ncbi:3-methyladenine DNA glycosylase 2 [Parazoarcus communis]|uniref:DNA-3-methyladenine glycosylase II n=1 Tax=Parazoarcus communis TaxID=41977 RepID=A0A2U8GX87_9RHOO|nr:3-methyladenine DNA glycosylase 2 [Parazoarcus communis]
MGHDERRKGGFARRCGELEGGGLENGVLNCELGLPVGFRSGDVLAFHLRDSLQVAEQVQGNCLRKGLAWSGRAACLEIVFEGGRAVARLDVDGPLASSDGLLLTGMVRRMLGLTQAVEDFEQTWCAHPQVGRLIAAHPGLRVPLAATPFEALSWAVTGQQISVAAALTIRRRLIEAVGLRHTSGLYCYPDAAGVQALGEPGLRAAGFSRAKALTLLTLSGLLVSGDLSLDAWVETPPIDDIQACLLRIRGIGPWTINYALLRGFGWLDGSLHGDVAVRRGLQHLLESPVPVSPAETERFLAEFSPWRALVAAHLWALDTAVSRTSGAAPKLG